MLKKIFYILPIIFLTFSFITSRFSNPDNYHLISKNSQSVLAIGESIFPTPTSTGVTLPPPTPTPDLTAPTVVITNPLNNSIVPKGTVVTINATAIDNVAVAKVQFFISNSLYCTDTTSPYTCNWGVPRKNMKHTITAKAFDINNNTSSTSIQVTSR